MSEKDIEVFLKVWAKHPLFDEIEEWSSRGLSLDRYQFACWEFMHEARRLIHEFHITSQQEGK